MPLTRWQPGGGRGQPALGRGAQAEPPPAPGNSLSWEGDRGAGSPAVMETPQVRDPGRVGGGGAVVRKAG